MDQKFCEMSSRETRSLVSASSRSGRCSDDQVSLCCCYVLFCAYIQVKLVLFIDVVRLCKFVP